MTPGLHAFPDKQACVEKEDICVVNKYDALRAVVSLANCYIYYTLLYIITLAVKQCFKYELDSYKQFQGFVLP